MRDASRSTEKVPFLCQASRLALSTGCLHVTSKVSPMQGTLDGVVRTIANSDPWPKSSNL